MASPRRVGTRLVYIAFTQFNTPLRSALDFTVAHHAGIERNETKSNRTKRHCTTLPFHIMRSLALETFFGCVLYKLSVNGIKQIPRPSTITLRCASMPRVNESTYMYMQLSPTLYYYTLIHEVILTTYISNPVGLTNKTRVHAKKLTKLPKTPPYYRTSLPFPATLLPFPATLLPYWSLLPSYLTPLLCYPTLLP